MTGREFMFFVWGVATPILLLVVIDHVMFATREESAHGNV